MNLIPILDLPFRYGDTRPFEFRYLNPGKTPIDLTGCDVAVEIGQATLDTASGHVAIDLPTATVHITLSDAEKAQYDGQTYRLKVIFPSGEHRVLWGGRVRAR